MLASAMASDLARFACATRNPCGIIAENAAMGPPDVMYAGWLLSAFLGYLQGGIPMDSDLKTIQYVANLAAIHLTEAEEIHYSRDLGAIMTYMEQLMAIGTGDVKPMEHVLSIRNALREDVAVNSDCREALMAVAPKTEEGCYLVPNVVE
jgi:aspartyl/glutamyl-tRNA(Asn/Gln) amidotransferase C subunit